MKSTLGPASARLTSQLGAIERLVRHPDAEARIAGDARAFLSEGGLAGADLDATVAFGAKRLLLYRKLVRGGLAAAIRKELPRTASRLGPLFDRYVGDFVSEAAPRSHYLRDVAFEFVAWAAPRLADHASVPDFLPDLARHELSEFACGGALDGSTAEATDVDLDRAVRFDPSARLDHYAFAVHELSADETSRDEPRRVETWLFGYRDANDDVRYLAVSPIAAAILTRLLAGETLRAAIAGASAESGEAFDDTGLAAVAALLTDLRDRGPLRGAAEEGP